MTGKKTNSEPSQWCGIVKDLHLAKWHCVMTLKGDKIDVTVTDMKATYIGETSLMDDCHEDVVNDGDDGDDDDDDNKSIRMEETKKTILADVKGEDKLKIVRSLLDDTWNDHSNEGHKDMRIIENQDGEKEFRICTRWGLKVPVELGIDVDIISISLSKQDSTAVSFLHALFDDVEAGCGRLEIQQKKQRKIECEMDNMKEAQRKIDISMGKEHREKRMMIYLNGLNRYKKKIVSFYLSK